MDDVEDVEVVEEVEEEEEDQIINAAQVILDGRKKAKEVAEMGPVMPKEDVMTSLKKILEQVREKSKQRSKSLNDALEMSANKKRYGRNFGPRYDM